MTDEVQVSSIQKLGIARQLLAEAKSLDDVLHIRDIAEAARVYAQAAKLGLENQNEAAEVKIRAERKAGEMLAQMPKATPTGSNQYEQRSHDVTDAPTLSDLGIEKMQSHRWQTMASLPEEAFEDHIHDIRSKGEELTSTGLYRKARQETTQANSFTPLETINKYRVIYADPPWSYGNTMPNYMGVQEDHYITMTLDEICAIPVKDICEDNAVLFLWVTSPILEESFRVVNAWGFKYKSSFVWDKEKHVMGHYNSVRHEFLLVCVRGSCQPDVQKLFDSVVTEERTEHSKKPEIFRTIIDTIYPNGKRIELFARGTHDGWDVYGNQV